MSKKLHLTYGVPEPIDIHVGTERAAFHLSPMADGRGRHVIKIFDNTGAERNQYLGSVRLESDPVAEAVEKERERCRALTETYLAAFPVVKQAWLDAIDAKPESVSAFTRGGEAFRELVKLRVHDWPCTDLCHDPAISWLNGLPGVTEPTDAK